MALVLASAIVVSTLTVLAINAPSASAVTIWGDESPHDILIESGDSTAEIGTRFSPTVDGSASAIRFYKAKGTTGSHTGTLYTTAGKALATVRFANESPSGWQVASLPKSVALEAGKSYVVSYRAPAGGAYVVTPNYTFISKSAAFSISDNDAGVFRSTTSETFSRRTWQSNQYWVDIVYHPAKKPHWASASEPAGSASASEHAKSATPTPTPSPSLTPGTKPTPSPSLTPGTKPTPTKSAKPTPAPTATTRVPTPKPTRPQSTSPSPAPVAKSFPTASTTGVPAGWKPKKEVKGDYTIGDDGAVVQDLRITGGILYIRGSNVTLRRIELVSARIVNEYAGVCYNGLQIEDSTILRGPTDLEMPVVESGGYTATRVKIDGVSEGFRVAGTDVGCGPVTIQDSWVRVVAPEGCTDNSSWHGDGIQGYLGVALTLRHTAVTLAERPNCTGTSAFFYPDQGNTRATIDNVLLSGGGYVFRLGTAGSVSNLKIVNNSWDFAPLDISSCSQVTWGPGNEVVDIAANGSLKSVRPLTCMSH
ncbi:DUF4082 domain-containing protein [Glutamicibacter protophormiae]|uniref:DUF4082 domain-containing protein n=1 Tax=Glutamicibacter protophormiae TaxID=37930 RepID=UPI003A917FE3